MWNKVDLLTENMGVEKYENGEHLNIHNATKEQLKLMVKDRDETIKRLQKELNEKQAALNEAIEMLKNCI